MSCSSVESYIVEGDFASADKYCSECKDEKRTKCLRTAADTCFYKLKNYSKAAGYYKELSDTAMYEKSVNENAMEYVSRKEYEAAGRLFCSIRKYDWFKTIQDNENKEIILFKKTDIKITEYLNLQKEKAGNRYYEILNKMDSNEKEFHKVTDEALRIGKEVLNSPGGPSYNDIYEMNKQSARANELANENLRLAEELKRLPKKVLKEANRIEDKEYAIKFEIQKIYNTLAAKGKGYSETVKGYSESIIGDFISE